MNMTYLYFVVALELLKEKDLIDEFKERIKEEKEKELESKFKELGLEG